MYLIEKQTKLTDKKNMHMIFAVMNITWAVVKKSVERQK